MTATPPPPAPLRPAPRGLLERVSIVWIIPIAALAIAVGVAWQSYSHRGPLIEITFASASGIRAGETELRHRDVSVGQVEDVGFTDALDRVKVSVRIENEIAAFVDEGAVFWVVEPRITTQGISGLDTVLSGVFIEGDWDTEAGGLQAKHAGLATQPLLGGGELGLQLRLRATPGTSMTESAPILYKGIVVGRIGKPDLSADGSIAVAEAAIHAPYDRLVSGATRFWDTSGFNFTLGAGGASLDVSSIASLIAGGITFDTLVSGGAPVEDGMVFDLYRSEALARASLFNAQEGPLLNLTVIFEDNVSGLIGGAPVELDGLQIGEVGNLTGLVDNERFGDDRIRLLATMEIRPQRLGLEDPGPDAAVSFFSDRVEQGLRARLASGSLLTGGLKIELVEQPDAPPATLDLSGDPFPILPSTGGNLSDISTSVEGVFQRINALPIEELIESAIGFLDSARALASDDALRQIPDEALALLGDARTVVNSEAVQSLSGNLNTLAEDLRETSTDLRAVLADVRNTQVIDRIFAAADGAALAFEGVEQGFSGVPELVERLNGLAENAGELPLDLLISELTETARTIDSFITSDSTQTLPGALNGALSEIEGAIADLRAGGTTKNVNQTLSSAGEAAQAIERAAEQLPELTARVDALLQQADAVLSGYDSRSEFGRSAQSALREVQRAANAMASLARALERRPNSVILGR